MSLLLALTCIPVGGSGPVKGDTTSVTALAAVLKQVILLYFVHVMSCLDLTGQGVYTNDTFSHSKQIGQSQTQKRIKVIGLISVSWSSNVFIPLNRPTCLFSV